MKNQRALISFTLLIVIIASMLSSALTLKYLFPRLLTQYENNSASTETKNNIPPSGDTLSLKQVESGVKSIAKQLRSSVVNIIINKDIQTYRSDPFGFFYEPSGTVNQKIGGGTGFFVTKDGLILTNKHVVSEPDATYTIITGDNEEFVGKVLAIDPLGDLAIIRAVTKDGKSLTDRVPVEFINDSKSVDVGTFVIAMGNALAEFQNTLTFGIISGLGRTIQAGNQGGGNVEQLNGLLQTDAAINPGNSGGPLVNLDGKVIGINTAIAAGANGLGFAIPLSTKEVDYLLTSLKKFNTIKRPFLGIKYVPLDANFAKANNIASDYGALIDPQNGIVQGGPADKAGLKPGDIILEVNGTELKNGKTIPEVLLGKLPGEKIKFTILPFGTKDTKTIEIELGSI